jgi:hypothetical protein
MTNGGNAHGRTGKKKPGGRKAKPRDPKASLKRRNLVPAALAAEKTR